jgi:hypothetical protein
VDQAKGRRGLRDILRGKPRSIGTELSLRQLCFREFDGEKGWKEVAREFKVTPETCRRYYQAWKKLPPHFEEVLRQTARIIRDPQTKKVFVIGLSRELAISPDMIEQILLRPWGLRSILLARFGLKRLNPTLNEKEKATLLNFMREVARSGRNVKDVLGILERRDAMRDDIVKEANRLFDPGTLTEEDLKMLKSLSRQSKAVRPQ